MRKTFLVICVIASMTVIVSKFSNKENLVNNLFLENVEALAAGEGGGNVRCIASGNTICPQIGVRVAYTVEPYTLE